MSKHVEPLPCPFCGHNPVVRAPFGRLAISCENKKCNVRPDTWLHAGDVYDIREITKFWNQRAETK